MHRTYCCVLKERQKTSFFSLFYMSINIGSLFTTILTPYIRSKSVCISDVSVVVLVFCPKLSREF